MNLILILVKWRIHIERKLYYFCRGFWQVGYCTHMFALLVGGWDWLAER